MTTTATPPDPPAADAADAAGAPGAPGDPAVDFPGDHHDPAGPAGDGGPIHTAGARARLTYQPAFDGFRGLGVLFVMFGHAGFTWMPGSFLSVSTFFTLSGFLITSLLIAEHRRHGSIDTRSFWLRRVRRLMPAAIITLLGAVLYGAAFADPS